MAVAQTNEAAFEEAIERDLLGLGYTKGEAGDFDKALAINTKMLFSFLEATQGKELARLSGHDWRERVPALLAKIIEKRGTLYVLKNEQRIDNIKLTLFYPKLARGNCTQDEKLYDKNIWGITRQQTYSLVNGRLEIDAVIFLNGFPLFALELKNSWTHQGARIHGIRQWKSSREPSEPLLHFGRCLAYMAVDTDEVWMASRLERENTRFIPFNKGKPGGQGAGNPDKTEGEAGFKTDYLWRDIFSPDTLSDIIMNFAMLDFGKEKAGKRLTDKTLNSAKSLIFPRYHQFDAVRELCKDASKTGVGGRYLIQHSAGSGKSNTITWLAYKLAALYPAQDNTAAPKDATKPLFDTIIVVTDRKALDAQIASYIQAAAAQVTIHAHADSASDLKELIEEGKRIVITTIEKFPYMCDRIAAMRGHSFAILIDEAHSSQSGDYSADMNKALAKSGADEDCNGGDTDELIKRIVAEKKLSENASFFAFTATPKSETLEKFGTKGEDGTFRPFHLYSMKQAIEEEFILDVTKRYTTFHCYCHLVKTIQDNPLFDEARAKPMLERIVNQDEGAIEYKARIILDHFDREVIKKKLLRGQARAMVVTHDITCAIRYYYALKKLCCDHRLGYEPLIAFSGKKSVGDIDYTEAKINGFGETQTAQKFDSEDRFRILVVANKYITGFDQPKLCAMYVDKHLAGIQAVQTLSRLNRCAPEFDKRPEDISVLDFCNTAEDIEEAFTPYYTAISLARETDPNTLNDLMADIMDVGMFTQEDLGAFAERFYRGQKRSSFESYIKIAAGKFNSALALTEEQKRAVKAKCKSFIKIYARVMPIIDYEVPDWDKLFEFLRLLVCDMRVQGELPESMDDLERKVIVKVYEARKRAGGAITLDAQASELEGEKAKLDWGGKKMSAEATLDKIIEEFNKRFEGLWDVPPEEQREDLRRAARAVSNDAGYKRRVKGNPDTHLAGIYFARLVGEILRERFDQGKKVRENYVANTDFRGLFVDAVRLLAGVFDALDQPTDGDDMLDDEQS